MRSFGAVADVMRTVFADGKFPGLRVI